MHPQLNLEELRTLDYDFMMQQQQQHQQPPQQPQVQQDGYGSGSGSNMGGDLDMFANAQFFDFDMGEMPDNSLLYTDDSYGLGDSNAGNATGRVPADLQNNDFNINAYQHQANNRSNADRPHSLQTTNIYSGQGRESNTSSNGSSPVTGDAVFISARRKGVDTATETAGNNGAMAIPDIQDAEELARIAAEEDKRRRNTAASARFRVKKKQREQALEKIAKEMTDRVNQLQTKVSQLEMENKILKSLITEKSGSEVDMDEVKRKVIEATPEDDTPSPKTGTKEKEKKARVKAEKVAAA